MNRTINVRKGLGSKKNLTKTITNLIETGRLASLTGVEDYETAVASFNNITGAEAFQNDIDQDSAKALAGLTCSQRFATLSSINTWGGRNAAPSVDPQLDAYVGAEGFSMANFKGDSAIAKGVNITVNALAHNQTPSAEKLFTTVTIPYQEEYLEFNVRTAGLGRYVYGASSFEKASDLRPVMSLIREGRTFMSDTLALHPVYPADDADRARKYFMDASILSPTDQSYDPADSMGRQTHKTQYFKPQVHITNLIGLCQAPGALPFDASDEIESNSLRLTNIILTGKVGATAFKVRLDTTRMSQANFGIAGMGQSSDDRNLDFKIYGLPASAFVDADTGAATTAFDALQPNGMKAFFRMTVSGNYQRQNNTLILNAGAFEIDYIKDANGKLKYLENTDNATVKALYSSLTEQEITGLKLEFNHTNSNHTNFGYRVEVYDARKILNTRRQTPVSVRYPVAKEDTNEDSLNFAIEQMAVVLNAQTTAKAFSAAEEHFNYVRSINGSAIVGNDQSSSVMAGQHFVNATAIYRKLKLADVVSTGDTVSTFDNVSAAIINGLTEVAAALATNSGMAAISEYTREKMKWTIVGHQNLGRYLMRSGDARTIGGYSDFEVELTNIDEMIGKFYIVPQSETTGDVIDPLGGMGVCVSKEHIVISGTMTRNDRNWGTVVSMPCFMHNSVCPIVGLLFIEDATAALSDDGLIGGLSKLQVTGSIKTSAAAGSTTTGDATTGGTSTGSTTTDGPLP